MVTHHFATKAICLSLLALFVMADDPYSCDFTLDNGLCAFSGIIDPSNKVYRWLIIVKNYNYCRSVCIL